MGIRWTGAQLLASVDEAFRDAGQNQPSSFLSTGERLKLESALEVRLADYVDLMVCSQCGEPLEHDE